MDGMAQFDVNMALSMLATEAMGRKVIYKSVTGTTMDDALTGAREHGSPHGTAYIAELMTKGRGTRGRQWNARNGGNLYVSFVIHKDYGKGELDLQGREMEYTLEVSVAMAIMRALEEEGVAGITVKWLNDLWIRGHKLCGALAEYKGVINVGMEQKHLLILGMGLNMNCDIRRDSSLCGLATSTLCETGREISREKLFAQICYHFEEILTLGRSELLEKYNEKQTLQRGQIYNGTLLEEGERTVECKYLGVNEDWTIDLIVNSSEMSVACHQMKVRPHPEKSVYILTGPNIENWSSQLLNNTFMSLVDTTRYSVRTVELIDGKAIPEDCALIVIGQWKPSPDLALTNQISPVSAEANQIREFVKGGGACICTGSSCKIFCDTTNQLGDPEIITVPVQLSTEDGREPVQISVPCFDPPQASLTDLIETEETVILASHSKESKVDSGESVIACNPSIIIAKTGRGKVCLSIPSFEITYADVEDHLPVLLEEVEKMEKGIFYRDVLILRVLHELGL